MHHFDYKNGALHAEEVAITTLADKIGTPFYCYSASTIRRHIQVFSQAFSGLDFLVCYAIKANSNQAVLRVLAHEGAGMDVVSGGELARALAAGRFFRDAPGPRGIAVERLLLRRRRRAGAYGPGRRQCRRGAEPYDPAAEFIRGVGPPVNPCRYPTIALIWASPFPPACAA